MGRRGSAPGDRGSSGHAWMLWSRAPSAPTTQARPGALASTSVSFVHTSALQTQVYALAVRAT